MERLPLRRLEVEEFRISPKDNCDTGETMVPDQLVSSRRKRYPLFFFFFSFFVRTLLSPREGWCLPIANALVMMLALGLCSH